MRTILPLSLVFAVLYGLQSPKNKDRRAEEELAKIQGTWQQVSGRANGEGLPQDLISDIRVLIKGNKKTVESSGQVIVRDVKIVLDPGTEPKAWDEEPKIDSGRRLVIRGIYKLEGDTLTRCIAAADEERPTEFASRPGSGYTLQVFRRVKADGDR